MMTIQYLNARWVLGWALIKHVLARPFHRRDPGKWVDRISQENLGPTPAGAWNIFASTSRCINCGLCDAVVPHGMQPSLWIMGSIRQPEDAPLAGDIAAKLRTWAPHIEKVCPARVDVRAVADLIDDQARALQINPLRGEVAAPRKK